MSGMGLRRGRPTTALGLCAVALIGVGAAASGCGLLDLDSFNGFTFDLPQKTYNVDTSDPKWSKPPAASLPSVPCGAPNPLVDCCTVPAALMSQFSVDCKTYPLVCEGGTCSYKFTYEVGSIVDLKKEVPQLNSSNSGVLKTIKLINIKVTLNNGLNIPLPPVDVFVAPMDATTASDTRARKLATLPGHAAGFNGEDVVPVDAAGQTAFRSFAQNYAVPFKLLARAQLTAKGGQAAPSGKAVVKVGGQVEAEL